ncbi:hypothetical protein M8J77_006344 [Diaphorina citri]|nr:hypothetical protein M8J77_006344 [Diaphorina citri]
MVVHRSSQCSRNDLKGMITRKQSNQQDDDTSSVTSASPLDPIAKKWLIRAAQADYQSLAKMASENPRLVSLKDVEEDGKLVNKLEEVLEKNMERNPEMK